MSHFSEVSIKIYSDRKTAITTALQAMGYKANQIEVSTSPQELRNYYGRFDGKKAHIRISPKASGPQIGIELKDNGDAVVHLDSMVAGRDWHNRFVQQYTRAIIKEVAFEHGYYIEEDKVDAKGEMTVTVQSQY